MMGAVMWEQEGRERYDASIVRFIEADGRVNVVFSNDGDECEGTVSLLASLEYQQTIGQFRYTYPGGYHGNSSVKGYLTRTSELIEFCGTWEDTEDGTGEWKFLVELEPEER